MAENQEVVPQETADNRRPDGTFGPGNNANPGGRPRGRSIVSVLREKLEEIPVGQTKAWKDQIVEMLLNETIAKNNVTAAKLILEYLETKPKQEISIDANKESVEALTGILRQISAHTNPNGATAPTSTESGGS